MFITDFYADIRRVYKNTQGNTFVKLFKICFVPSLHITFVYRLGHSFSTLWPPFSWLLLIIYLPMMLVIRLLYNTTLPVRAKIGPGFIILHPGAIFIHPGTVIDNDVTIGAQVIIGAARLSDQKYPYVSNNVFIGSGAKILGPIRVNHHTTVGANTVVLKDTPASSVVVGNPGKVIKVHKPKKHRNRPHGRPKQRNSNVRIHSDKRSGIIHV
jgi:serine O-acetyltransferase